MPDRHHTAGRASGIWLAVVLLTLTATNLAAHLGRIDADLVIPVTAGVLTAVALAVGHTHAELGLASGDAPPGLRWGLTVAAVVIVPTLAGALLPATRELFQDERYAALGTTLLSAVVLVPLTTVIPEELLFRGVLHGTLTRLTGPHGQRLIGGAAFGLWHALVASHLTADNAGLDSLVGAGPLAQLTGVGAVVLATGVAGAVFVELRRRSGSLLAPGLLHWALNGTGAIAAHIAWRLA